MRRCGNCIRKWNGTSSCDFWPAYVIDRNGTLFFSAKSRYFLFTAGMAGSSFLLLYTGMTGNGIASQRAWIMFAMRMGAEITGREYDALTGLAAAAVWICLRQPLYLTDAGFLLSFGAILGIILIEPVYAGEKRRRKRRSGKRSQFS